MDLNKFKWLRKIPTPTYGKCGGASKDCSTSKPRDWMDLAFEEHDEDLRIAALEKIEGLRKLAESAADRKLGKTLRSGDKKELGLWGRIYLFGAKLVFKV